MDAMALLCNMHADGPATIKVLRRAGLLSLSEIARAPHERIADLLGVSPAYARRFAREARLLGERMSESALDPEEHETLELRTVPEHPPTPELRSTPELRFEPEVRFESSLEIDPKAARAAGGDMRPERSETDRERREMSAPAPGSARARVVPMSGTRLAPGLIEGLDAAWCDRLIAQGVLTLETLVDAPLMRLARRLGVPLTSLMDLQMLAQRGLVERAFERDAGAREPEPEYVIPTPGREVLRDRDELGLRDEAAALGEDMDPALASAYHLAHRDASEDVGGPFA
jgi:hypothetical protein